MLECGGKKTTSKFNKSKIMVVALTIIALALSATTYAAITINQDVPTSGTITTSPNVGVFSDTACTQSLTSLTWGTIAPGNSVTRTIYVKNTGAGASIDLSMTTLSWTPAEANGPITITWNRQGTSLAPGESATAVITLAISSSIVDVADFSVTIRITGTSP